MSRVALIGENSIEYIDKLIDIWNNGDCAVLINCRIPPNTAIDMMYEANVSQCYIERKYFEEYFEISVGNINFIPYEKEIV